ncbi:unnamed protein product [Rotaria magnacalcarata]|uniref:F-box domain-containing protein n=3 Tax=Rotaria magnacalcarata TaxID=392030 RepID=A0A816WE23_9BILA|nr:unnamed protein product [Rotaria magnacalcarata]
MSLELLANELLLDIFEFLNVHNLFRAFHGLNTRIDQLLLIQLQKYYLDFRSIAKHDFEFFSQQHLTSINDRIISLHISDDIETPNLPELLLSHGYRISQFIHLKSLSIDSISSFDLLNQIILQCHELSYLTHLNIMIQNNHDPEENFRDFINSIWSLTKLTHCNLDIQYPYATWLLEMSAFSKSIKYLSTRNISYNEYNLSHLIKHTPQLRGLDMSSIGIFYNQYPRVTYSSLISLNMVVECALEFMKNFFQRMPNLCYLTLEINNMNLDGQALENILIKYFHNIKTFRFKMTVEFSPLEDLEEQVDQCLDSFRSHYWIAKHKLYVQCDWCPKDVNKTGLVYSIPYAFDTFNFVDGSQSKSSSPCNLNNKSRNSSKIVHYTHNKIDFSKFSILDPVEFVNIRHLKIRLPFNDIFWSHIPRLDQLISLDVKLSQNFGYSQLQTFLDRAPNLYLLRFCHLNNFSMKSFGINSRSIRRLEFFQNFQVRLKYFNSEECTILSNSSLAAQCEVLLIDVENRTDILQLINVMPNLRALSVRTKDNESNQLQSWEITENLIEWLHKNLPSNYTYSITRNFYNLARINIWISTAS